MTPALLDLHILADRQLHDAALAFVIALLAMPLVVALGVTGLVSFFERFSDDQ